jgi:hypothetical protein
MRRGLSVLAATTVGGAGVVAATTDRETLRRGYTLWTEVAPVVVEYRYTEFRHNHNLDNMPWPIGSAPIGSSVTPSNAEKEASQSADWARLHAKHADNVVSCAFSVAYMRTLWVNLQINGLFNLSERRVRQGRCNLSISAAMNQFPPMGTTTTVSYCKLLCTGTANSSADSDTTIVSQSSPSGVLGEVIGEVVDMILCHWHHT